MSSLKITSVSQRQRQQKRTQHKLQHIFGFCNVNEMRLSTKKFVDNKLMRSPCEKRPDTSWSWLSSIGFKSPYVGQSLLNERSIFTRDYCTVSVTNQSIWWYKLFWLIQLFSVSFHPHNWLASFSSSSVHTHHVDSSDSWARNRCETICKAFCMFVMFEVWTITQISSQNCRGIERLSYVIFPSLYSFVHTGARARVRVSLCMLDMPSQCMWLAAFHYTYMGLFLIQLFFYFIFISICSSSFLLWSSFFITWSSRTSSLFRLLCGFCFVLFYSPI